jgi:sodium-dependent dicarboxylate transporter 2/3/5
VSRKLRNLLVAVVPIALALLLARLNAFQSWLDLDRPQEIALTILLVTATLWVTEAMPLFATSFVVLFLQLVWLAPAVNASRAPEDAIADQAFLSPFFSDIILLFLGGFVLSAVLHKYGLDKRMAGWILHRTGTRPANLLIGIIAVSAFLSMWMSNTATAAMMLAIVLPIISGIPVGNRFSKALALAIPFACNLGGLGTPIGTPPNAIAMTYLRKVGITLSFGEWMIATFPFLLLFLAFLWFLLLRLHPPGDLRLEIEMDASGKLGGRHRAVVVLFLVTCAGWLTTAQHGLSLGTVSLVPLVVCFGFRFLDGRDFRGLSWDVLFMLGGGLTLGVGLSASGLTEAIVQRIPADPTIAFALFAVLAMVLTTFMSNTATANLLIPIAVSLEGPIAPLIATIAMMCSTTMALPVSTPPNAIAFGSGILRAKDMILPGSILALFALIVVFLLAPWYWGLLAF